MFRLFVGINHHSQLSFSLDQEAFNIDELAVYTEILNKVCTTFKEKKTDEPRKRRYRKKRVAREVKKRVRHYHQHCDRHLVDYESGHR